MNLIKKYKKYLRISALVWAVCFVAFVLVYFFIMSPEYKKRNKIEKEFAKSRTDYELAQKATQEETKIRLNGEISLLQNKLDDFVMEFKSAKDLTFDISRIAGECKLSSFSIESDNLRASSASTEPKNIFEKHIKVNFVAGFQEFALFLNSLERHQPVLFVNQFSLSRRNNDNTTYQVTLDIAAFVQRQQVVEADNENADRIVGMKL